MSRPSVLWKKWLGPLPGRNEARVMSLLALAAGLVACIFGLVKGFRGEAFMGRPLGGDFVQFYVIGKIANQFGLARIYDLDLAVRLQHSTLATMSPTQMLVFAHAPFIAVLFQPFALLPYEWAYVAWLIFSALLYTLAALLLFQAMGLRREDARTGLLLALSSAPFLFETWIGGQLSVAVFAVWAAFFFLRSRTNLFLAGGALALATFKPTLIALPVLMLIFGRRWRILAGFATGSAALALGSVGLAGTAGMRAWIGTMLFNGRIAANGGAVLRRPKSLDLNAFFHLILGEGSAPIIAAFCVSGVLILLLAVAWRKSTATDTNQENLLWAATISFTLIASTYSLIYDAAVAVVAASAAASGLSGRSNDKLDDLSAWLVLLYLVPWITQSFAEFLHVQLLVPVLAGFGLWALKLTAEVPEGNAKRQQQDALGHLAAFQ